MLRNSSAMSSWLTPADSNKWLSVGLNEVISRYTYIVNIWIPAEALYVRCFQMNFIRHSRVIYKTSILRVLMFLKNIGYSYRADILSFTYVHFVLLCQEDWLSSYYKHLQLFRRNTWNNTILNVHHLSLIHI